jgi:hypothetical protein
VFDGVQPREQTLIIEARNWRGTDDSHEGCRLQQFGFRAVVDGHN